jgi:hypothetical protein
MQADKDQGYNNPESEPIDLREIDQSAEQT